MLRVDYLHAQVFGRHTHPCYGVACNGALRACSEQYDCQPGPKLCSDCYLDTEERSEQRAAWREVDRVFQTGVMRS